MTFCFYTLGCKVNQYETQAMREILQNNGYFAAQDNKCADIYIINSCTVTAESDRKTRQIVRRYKRNNPNSIIVLTGCMTQAFPQYANELDCADIIIGNSKITHLPQLINRFIIERKQIIDIIPHEKGEKFSTPCITNFDERTRAFIKIEDGCERYCTYCIIPTARGRVRSKSIEDLKFEVEALNKKGFIEIVLVGINLSAYGKDIGLNLCDAVEAVCECKGIKRVRLGSLEPDHISDEMLFRLFKQEKFCPQFHLSLQSGCDATLKRMNRHYDSAFYYDLVNRIRAIFPTAAITTDIMVGFAGETDQEFNHSLDFVKKVGFAKSHIFAYSRRKGTFADKMPSQVTKEVKEQRSRIMIKETEKSEREFLFNQIGCVQQVLFETFENGFAYGYTANYCRVRVKCNEHKGNKIFNVKILECDDTMCLIGEFI